MKGPGLKMPESVAAAEWAWQARIRPLYRFGRPAPARAPGWFGRLVAWIARR